MKSVKETAEKIIGTILEREDLETADAEAVMKEITKLTKDEISSMIEKIDDFDKTLLAKLFLGHTINRGICNALKEKSESDQRAAELFEKLSEHAEKTLEGED